MSSAVQFTLPGPAGPGGVVAHQLLHEDGQVLDGAGQLRHSLLDITVCRG